MQNQEKKADTLQSIQRPDQSDYDPACHSNLPLLGVLLLSGEAATWCTRCTVRQKAAGREQSSPIAAGPINGFKMGSRFIHSIIARDCPQSLEIYSHPSPEWGTAERKWRYATKEQQLTSAQCIFNPKRRSRWVTLLNRLCCSPQIARVQTQDHHSHLTEISTFHLTEISTFHQVPSFLPCSSRGRGLPLTS